MCKITNRGFLLFSISLVIVFVGLLIAQITYAISRNTVIVFCTEWNAKCRKAVPAIESVVNSYGGRIDVQQFNIDLNTTPEKARALGINIPSKIPHVVVLDRNGRIIFEQDYTSQTNDQLRSVLDTLTRQ